MLPAEMLATIFIFTIPRGNDRHAQGKPSHHPLPFLRVCKAWKEVALRTPDLWTSLVLNSHRAKPALVGPGVQTWFARAKDKPLSFIANLKPGRFLRTNFASSIPWSRLTVLEINNDFALPLDVARSILMRCTNIETCTFGGIEGWSKRKKAMPGAELIKLRFLRNLTIEFDSSGSRNTNSQTEIHWLFLPLILPRLKKLEIRATHSSTDECLMPALLAVRARSNFSLTHLHLGRIVFDCADLSKLLRASPRLRHLYLEGTTTPQFFAPLLGNLVYKDTKRTYILPNLEELVVIDSSPDEAWLSWDATSLKFLESRSWRGEDCPYGEPGLSKLRDVAIIWKSTSSFPSRGNNSGTQRAKKLRDDGLLLFYPTLAMSRQERSRLNIDFWWM